MKKVKSQKHKVSNIIEELPSEELIEDSNKPIKKVMNRNIDFKTLRSTPTMAERKTRSGKVFKQNTLPEISSQDEDDMDGDLEAEMEEEGIRIKAKKSTKKTSSNTSSPNKIEKRKYKKNYGTKDVNPEAGKTSQNSGKGPIKSSFKSN